MFMPLFWVPRTINCRMHTLFIKKGVDNFEIEYKNANFEVGGARYLLKIHVFIICQSFPITTFARSSPSGTERNSKVYWSVKWGEKLVLKGVLPGGALNCCCCWFFVLFCFCFLFFVFVFVFFGFVSFNFYLSIFFCFVFFDGMSGAKRWKGGLKKWFFFFCGSKVNMVKALRGYCTPGQFLDCFCIFVKNYNTLVTSKICFL